MYTKNTALMVFGPPHFCQGHGPQPSQGQGYPKNAKLR